MIIAMRPMLLLVCLSSWAIGHGDAADSSVHDGQTEASRTETEGSTDHTPNDSKAEGKDAPKRFVTRHELALADGPVLKYTATAGETFLKDDSGEAKASVFTISYTKDDVSDPSSRPIAFVFNGGPGSSAVWLHLGLLGPKRVNVPSDGTDAGAPPYRLEDNPFSLLCVSDLVFVDPVGTGFSRAKGDNKDESYWGVDEDSLALTQFIRNYITDNKRWNSPKYLIGESYGSIRAAVLVRDLQASLNAVAMNGVVLVGPAMDTRFLVGYGTDVPFVTYLPTYAATAWYHNALPNRPPELKAFLDEVKEFAATDYLIALFRGATIDDATKTRLLEKLHQYTGLSKIYLKNANFRVNTSRFRKELLRDRGLIVGRFDSRYTGSDPGDNAGEYAGDDPSGYGVDGAFVATMNDYLTRDLKVKMDRRYMIMNYEANTKWKAPGSHASIFSGFLNVLPHFAQGMASNKHLRVFVASGYFDLTTSFFASEYMVSHSDMDPERVTIKHYEAGHMMYVHRPSFEKLAKDLREFIETD